VIVLTCADAIRTANNSFGIRCCLLDERNLGRKYARSLPDRYHELAALVLLNFGAMGVLILLIDPIIHLFGPQYFH